MKDDKAERPLVEVGQSSDFEAEIRQGLKPGEVVILHPTEQINDGSRVMSR